MRHGIHALHILRRASTLVAATAALGCTGDSPVEPRVEELLVPKFGPHAQAPRDTNAIRSDSLSRLRPDSLPVLVIPAPSLATPIASADTSPPANANAGSLTRNTMGGREGNRSLSDAMREQSLGFRNDASSDECLSEGDSFGSWELRFTGYGCVGLTEGDGSLTMAPMIATANDETHAPLILGPQYGDRLMMTARVETVQQLRKNGDPNAWEVAWVIWNYTDDEHFYYFIPKPNGWELGKRDPAYPGGQRFLATGTEQTFPVGRAYNVQVMQRGNVSTVMVDGIALTSFTDTERPYVAGRIGLYSEDAAIKVHGVKVRAGSF